MCDFLLQSFVSALTLLPLSTKTLRGRLTVRAKQLQISEHQTPELKTCDVFSGLTFYLFFILESKSTTQEIIVILHALLLTSLKTFREFFVVVVVVG